MNLNWILLIAFIGALIVCALLAKHSRRNPKTRREQLQAKVDWVDRQMFEQTLLQIELSHEREGLVAQMEYLADCAPDLADSLPFEEPRPAHRMATGATIAPDPMQGPRSSFLMPTAGPHL